MHKIDDEQYNILLNLVNLALFIAIAIVISIFEAFIPFTSIVPGLKLGLSNIILILIMPHYKFSELLFFQIVKISVTTLILGLFSVYLFSLVGGVFALVAMFAVYKVIKKANSYTLSVFGGVFHNVGQIGMAIFYLHTPELILYLPILTIFGSLTGMFNGFIITKLKDNFERNFNAIN